MLHDRHLLFAELVITVLALSVVLLSLQAPESGLLLEAIDLLRKFVDLKTSLSVGGEQVGVLLSLGLRFSHVPGEVDLELVIELLNILD